MDFTDIGTKSTPEYQELWNIHMATELVVHTGSILEALSKDPNQEPIDELREELQKQERCGILVEKDPKREIIRASVITRENNKIYEIYMNKGTEQMGEPITKETYDTLTGFCIEPLEQVVRVEEKLKNAK